MKELLKHSLVKFLLVGGLSLMIDYGLLLLLHYWVGLELIPATTTAYLTGLVVNFGLNKLWSFQAKSDAKKTAKQAALYAVLVGINLLLVNITVSFAANLSTGPELSKPIATALLLGMNYFAYKTIIFKQDDLKDEP